LTASSKRITLLENSCSERENLLATPNPRPSRDRLGPKAGVVKASKAQDPARAERPSASAGPEAVAVALVRGPRGRADRDRYPVLVTNGELARIAVKPFLSSIVGSASDWLALAERLARDLRFAVFLAALRVLRLIRLTGRLARIFDPFIVLDPAVVPRAGLSLARLLYASNGAGPLPVCTIRNFIRSVRA
jgi:hypothetical protein